MKRFDVWANIVAGALIWLFLTGIVLLISIVNDYDPSAPFQRQAVILAFFVFTFALYARHYWKKRDR